MMSARLDMSHFESRRKAIAKAPLVASKAVVDAGGRQLRDELGDDTAKALKQKHGYDDPNYTMWGYRVYPEGARLANDPAAVVYARAPHIIEGFSSGETIKGKQYIPIEGSPADIRKPRNGSRVAAMIKKFGRPLELPQKDGSGWLLLFRTRTSSKSGKLISAQVTNRKTGLRVTATRGVTWTPLFVVEPQVTLGRRLNSEAIIARFSAKWPDLAAARFIAEMNKL